MTDEKSFHKRYRGMPLVAPVKEMYEMIVSLEARVSKLEGCKDVQNVEATPSDSQDDSKAASMVAD